MALGDPFGTTYAGAYRGRESIGQGFMTAAKAFAEAMEKSREQKKEELFIKEERKREEKLLKEEREFKREQDKPAVIAKAYEIAREVATTYLEEADRGLHPEDDNPGATARALAETTFDNFMQTSGYSEITYLGATGQKIEEEEAEKKTPSIFGGLGETFIPKRGETKVSPSAPLATQFGAGVAETGKRVGQAAGRIPLNILGGLANIPERTKEFTEGVTTQVPQARAPVSFIESLLKTIIPGGPTVTKIPQAARQIEDILKRMGIK